MATRSPRLLAAIAALAAVFSLAAFVAGNAFAVLPKYSMSSSTLRGSLGSSDQQTELTPEMSEGAWTQSGGLGVVCGIMMMAFGIAKAQKAPVAGKNVVSCSAFGARAQGNTRSSSITSCKAEEGTSLLQRKRCDGHGFAKGDPEFDVTDASSLGETVTVEFKKRPTGVMRYSHGTGGKGAIILDMQEKSRYPGDPKGQCALGGVKKKMVIKSIAGQECIDWSFIDIMDLLDDYEFQPTDTKEAKDEWKARSRKYEATPLPCVVEFQECKVTEVDEDVVAPKLEGKWYPRGQPFSDADLAAELARVKKDHPVPSDYSGVVYSGPGCLDEAWIQALMDQQKDGILLPMQMAYELVIDTIKVLNTEKTMSEFEVKEGDKVTVCGDTHGQYWDVMNIFKMNGLPSASNPYLFNGDFVDRGSWGIENICLLYALKVKDPSSMHFNRGNHELIEANMIYGFAGECMKKYDDTLFDLFSESFRKLSLCHLINKEVFVTHGGLPGPNPRIYVPGMSHDPSDAIPRNEITLKLDEIAACDRETELQAGTYKTAVDLVEGDVVPEATKVSETRIVIDLIWGDPRLTNGYGPSYRKSRGIFMFGPDVTDKFCEDNNLKFCVRSHEVKEDGWKQDHPKLYTVFSAPNYMDVGGNRGAFLTLTNVGGSLECTPTEFEKSDHPDVPPMIWQAHFAETHPHLTKKMKKKTGPIYDSNGMLVQMSKQELEDAQNQWVEDDEEGDIDGVEPGRTIAEKAKA